MGRLSETMCFQTGGCILIAIAGAMQCSPPCFANILLWEKQGRWARWMQPLDTEKCGFWSTRQMSKGEQGATLTAYNNAFYYRSRVPDEDLGAAVGELVCRNLEVGHQHLHSFPVGSRRSQRGRPTSQVNISNINTLHCEGKNEKIWIQ